MAYADRNFPRPAKLCVTCSKEYRPTGARQVACGECKQARRKAMRQQRIPLKIFGCVDCGFSIQKNGRKSRCDACQVSQLARNTAAYRERHPERNRELQRQSAKRNQGKRIAAFRARQQSMMVRSFDHERDLVQRIYEDRDVINRIFPHVKAHVDHIVPLKHTLVSGLHVVANLRVIRGSENIKKRNKFMENLAA